MCSIFGSSDPDEFFELSDLNQSRGVHAWSWAGVFRDRKTPHKGDKGKGKFPQNISLTGCDGDYYLGHVQTRTGTDSGMHPAVSQTHNYWLFHNGILLPDFVPENVQWDTQYLLDFIIGDGSPDYVWYVDKLSQIRGSFACVLVTPELILVFRNDNAPLYYRGSTISSVEFEGSQPVPANHVHVLNLHRNELQPCKHGEFTNADTMYRIT